MEEAGEETYKNPTLVDASINSLTISSLRLSKSLREIVGTSDILYSLLSIYLDEQLDDGINR